MRPVVRRVNLDAASELELGFQLSTLLPKEGPQPAVCKKVIRVKLNRPLKKSLSLGIATLLSF